MSDYEFFPMTSPSPEQPIVFHGPAFSGPYTHQDFANANGNLVVPLELRRKAKESLDFLRGHPAFGDSGFDYRCLCWGMAECDANGVWGKDGSETIHWNEPKAQEFKDRFLTSHTQAELDKDPESSYIYVSYEEKYGKAWEYDHSKFWWELSFLVYEGDLNRNSMDYCDHGKWGMYAFEMGGATSWEQCLVDMANIVREKLGDFNDYDSFRNTFEEQNHEEQESFFFIDSDVEVDGHKCQEMKSNEKSWRIHPGIINRRWLKWFSETPYCKEKWTWDGKEHFKSLAEAKIPVKNEKVPKPENQTLWFKVKGHFDTLSWRVKRITRKLRK